MLSETLSLVYSKNVAAVFLLGVRRISDLADIPSEQRISLDLVSGSILDLICRIPCQKKDT
jgi:hypothetical protein